MLKEAAANLHAQLSKSGGVIHSSRKCECSAYSENDFHGREHDHALQQVARLHGTIPGDIVFVVQEKEHPTFKRKGPDLFLEKDISLVEALCGFQMTVTHLDKRQLVISTNEGDVVKPGSFKAVYDEGMPTYQQPFNKGKLFIHFNVKFPEPGDLSDDDMKALEKIFPARIPVEIDPDAAEECNMHDVDIEQEMRRNKSSGRTAYEEDDDDDMGGQRVQCAQQ